MPTKDEVLEALKSVVDPELGFNIVNMGLIYDVKVKKDSVKIKMTFTSMMCPMSGLIEERVRSAVERLKGVKHVDIEIVWEPPWSPEKMSEEIRAELGL
jgi:metal-sulfur cluster biosynthetic enzyme